MRVLIRSAALNQYAEVARSVGLDPYRMVRAAGLSQVCLSQPDLKIPADKVHALLEQSAAQAGIDNFGLRMAERRRLTSMGSISALAHDEPTVRQALESLVHHMHQHYGTLILQVEEKDGGALIRDKTPRLSHSAPRQSTELALGVVVRILRIFLGSDWFPQQVCFSHAAPDSLTLHTRLLGSNLQFGSPFNGIACRSEALDTPIAASDPVMAHYARYDLEAPPIKLTAVASQVRHLIVVLLPAGRCSIEEVARLLSMDRKTLYRQLALEGVTFTSILNTMRRELAARYLDQPHHHLTEVASLLGFADLSAFSRWHRLQHGTSPSHIRKHTAPESRSTDAANR